MSAPHARTFSLRSFFALLLGGTILLPTLLLGYKSYTALTASILEGSSTSTRYAVEATRQSIFAMTAPAAGNLAILGAADISAARTLEERLAFLPFMAAALGRNDVLEAVFVGYPSGDFLYLRRYSESLRKISRHRIDVPGVSFLLLSVSATPEGLLKEEWYLNEKLEKVARNNDPSAVFDLRERAWFRAAQESGKTTSTRPYMFFGTRDLGITMARKADRGDAVLGFDILTTDLRNILESLRVTPGTEVAIVDAVDEVMSFTSPLAPGPEHLGPDGSVKLTALGVPAFDRMLSAQVSPGDIQTYKDEEDTWFGSVAEMGNFYGNPLRLFISIPGSELLQKAEQQKRMLLAFTAVVFIVFLFGGVFLARWMYAPVGKMLSHLSLLSEFNFSNPLRVDAVFTETGQLVDAINSMARSLYAFQRILLVLNNERDEKTMFGALLQNTLALVRLERGGIYLWEKGELVLVAVAGGWRPPEKIEMLRADLPEEEIVSLLQERLGAQHLHMPLRSAAGGLLGVLCVDQRAGSTGEQPYEKKILLGYLQKIASAAAVGVETRQLIAAQRGLLDGMIHLIAKGIDAKSSHTWGHCNRVPELALMIARAVNGAEGPPFGEFSFSPEQEEEFRIAAWLHDCGKLTTPEYIVDKATKLETLYDRLHEIRTRFEVLHRDATIRCLTEIMDGGAEPAARERLRAEHEELFRDFAFVARCNIGGEFMDPAAEERLRVIAEKTWMRHFDATLGLSRGERSRLREEAALPAEERLIADKPCHRIPWPEEGPPPVRRGDPGNTLGFDMQPPPFKHNTGELYNLSIRYGTLTEEERFKINEHIVQTLSMLHSLPWPEDLRRVPDIAGGHHESPDGRGYPRKLRAEEIGIPERILALADIFEALTAPDRPYKNAKKLSEAVGILAAMAGRNQLDKDVFALFLQSGIYRAYAEKYMPPELVDSVDVEGSLKEAAGTGAQGGGA